MNVLLVGFMGSGKSTLGKVLAEQLRYTFIETDVLLERSEGCSIPELFEKKGEAWFREKETALLHHLQLVDHCVIATGGGMPCFTTNMDIINRIGTSIWLDVDETELEKRLWNDRSSRPVLAGYASLQEAIHELLALRKPYYVQANIQLKNPDAGLLVETVKSLVSGT